MASDAGDLQVSRCSECGMQYRTKDGHICPLDDDDD